MGFNLSSSNNFANLDFFAKVSVFCRIYNFLVMLRNYSYRLYFFGYADLAKDQCTNITSFDISCSLSTLKISALQMAACYDLYRKCIPFATP